MSGTMHLDENVGGGTGPGTAGDDNRRAPSAVVESCCAAILDRLLDNCDVNQVALKSVGVSSVTRAAGVSTVALNLAIAAGRKTARRIVFVEANWQRPALTRTLSVTPGPGLVELIQGQADMPDCIRSTAIGRLHLLPFGEGTTTNVGARRWHDILEMLEDTYDLVVLDLPPIVGLNGRLAWLARLTGIVLVIDVGQTLLEDVRQASDQLGHADVHVLGTVLNKC